MVVDSSFVLPIIYSPSFSTAMATNQHLLQHFQSTVYPLMDFTIPETHTERGGFLRRGMARLQEAGRTYRRGEGAVDEFWFGAGRL
jgi:hypothetical protein